MPDPMSFFDAAEREFSDEDNELAALATKGPRHRVVRRGEREPIPAILRRLVYERDGHRCRRCGRTEYLQLDHVVPWSAGGADMATNLRTLCKPCNDERSNWREWEHPRLLPVTWICDPCCLHHDETRRRQRHQRHLEHCPVCVTGEYEQDQDSPQIVAYCGSCRMPSWVTDPGRLK